MCYSDHNEDIRTKGVCDYCGESEPENPTGFSTDFSIYR